MLDGIRRIRVEDKKTEINQEVIQEMAVVEKKKGRRPKNYKEGYMLNRDRSKFIIDLGSDKNSLELIFKLLTDANQKDYGREITFKDLAIFALEKINAKDIEKIQESSMDEMGKVERALKEFNSKNGTTLSLGEFLVKKLNIN